MEYIDTFNIDNIKRKMLVKYPFFGSAVASLKLKEAKGLGTAETDGKTVYYDPEFLSKLNEEEQSFIFAHEICHIAFNHILRSEGKNPRIWNIATDAVINQFLKRDGLPLVKGGVDIEDALNYDAERLYEKMLQEEKEQQREQGSGQQSNGENLGQQQEQSNSAESQSQESKGSQEQSSEQSSGGQSTDPEQEEKSDQVDQKSGQSSSEESSNENQNESKSNSEDVGHDTHSMWEEAVKRYKENGSFDNEEEKENDNAKTQDEMADEKLKDMQEKLIEIGEKKSFEKNEQTRKEQLAELLEALSRESMDAGTTTNSERRETKNVGTSKPLIDWRLWLREAISMNVDWSFANAEIEDGVVRPNLEDYPIPETEILLDTSGSIHENLLKNFLRECKNIFQASRVKVGCFDTRFYGWNEVRTMDDIDNIEYLGGGGTDFNIAVNAFTKRVENKIVFTDGEAPMPNTPMNAIWIVFGGEKINPPGGKVIHITEEQLRSLCYENTSNSVNRRMK